MLEKNIFQNKIKGIKVMRNQIQRIKIAQIEIQEEYIYLIIQQIKIMNLTKMILQSQIIIILNHMGQHQEKMQVIFIYQIQIQIEVI